MRKKPVETDNGAEKSSNETHTRKRYEMKTTSKIVIVVSALIFIALIFGAVFMWARQTDNSNKLLLNAITKAIAAKTYSTVYTTSSDVGGVAYTSRFEGQGGYAEGFQGRMESSYSYGKDASPLKSDLDVLQDPVGKTYIKFKNIDDYRKMIHNQIQAVTKNEKVSQEAIKQKIKEFDKQIDTLAKTATDKWIDTTSAGVKDAKSLDNYRSACAKKNAFGDNKKINYGELASAYEGSTFFTVKKDLGVKDGDHGFLVRADSKVFGKFMEALRPTAFFSQVSKCGYGGVAVLSKLLNLLPQSGQQGGQAGTVDTEFWVNPETQNLDRIVVTTQISMDGQNKNSMKFEASMKYDVPVEVETPQDAIPYEKAMPFLGASNGLKLQGF